MKTKLFKIAAFMLAIVMALSLAACAEPDDGSGKMTVVVGGGSPVEYVVDLDEIEVTEGLISVLKYLKQTKKLDYATEGTMLTKVGNLENSSVENKWIYLYTTVAEDIDVSEYATTVEYNGQTITSSGVGAFDMHMEEGALIYIGIISWG